MHEYLFVNGPAARSDPELMKTVRSHATRHVRRRQREARDTGREGDKTNLEQRQSGTAEALRRKGSIKSTSTVPPPPRQNRRQCSQHAEPSTLASLEWTAAPCSMTSRPGWSENGTRKIGHQSDAQCTIDPYDTAEILHKWPDHSGHSLPFGRFTLAQSRSTSSVDEEEHRPSDTNAHLTLSRQNAISTDEEVVSIAMPSAVHGRNAIVFAESSLKEPGATSGTSILYGQPSLAFGCESDRNALQYFYSRAARDISGVIIVGFWDRVVLQTCYAEPAVRLAVVALSQAHTEHATIKESPLSIRQASASANTLGSLKSYLHASGALRAYVGHTAAPRHEIVLVCNIIFHTLAALRGEDADARAHLDCGLSIFSTWQAMRQGSLAPPGECYDHIATMLARFDLSATIADDHRIPQFKYDKDESSAGLDSVDGPLVEFTSAHDAHHQLLRISAPAWAFVVSNKQYRDISIQHVPEDVQNQKRFHASRYRAWNRSMDAFEWKLLYSVPSCTDISKESGHDRTALLVSTLATRMHYWCGKRILRECLRDEDLGNIWDRGHEKLFRYAETILELTTEANNDRGSRKGFSPELGICSIPLALAHRTSLPHVRSKAIQIKRRFGRQEGTKPFYDNFESWAQMQDPKPPFKFMNGWPGH